jgi:flavin reductase (DIM6/NTAB) family NADH-FMN oxidoreductase RutF
MKERFIKTMKSLTYPVCIASTQDSNFQYAITVSSVTSVSIDPPSLLVCINKSSAMNAAIKLGANMAINFLGSGQKEIASICSSKERVLERFDNDLWSGDSDNTPYLKDSKSIAFCKIANIVEHTTHVIVLLCVYEVILNNQRVSDQLLYCDGNYSKP